MIAAIIQARMSSTRLPGKVMKPILGKPMFWHLISRIKRCKTLDDIILATTSSKSDDRLYRFAKRMGIKVYRGKKDDVLDRYYQAAKKNGANIVKIAARANKTEDIIRLIKFTYENKNKNLITVSLGAMGSISRLIFPKFGSLITYSYITKPSGTGQIPLEKLQEHLRLYYPQYNQYYIAKSGSIAYA